MKGLEFKMLFGLIILVVVILLVILIVINPSLIFGKTTEARISFEEFCVFWSLNGYAEGLGEMVKRDSKEYGYPEQYCAPVLRKLIITDPADIETCKKCCRKEIAC